MASNLVNESPDTYPTAPVPLRRPRLDSAQRFLLVCGMLLVVSGIFHGIVLFATGGSLEPELHKFSAPFLGFDVQLVKELLSRRWDLWWKRDLVIADLASEFAYGLQGGDDAFQRHPGLGLHVSGHGQCSEDHRQVSLDGLASVMKHWPGSQIGFGHPKGLLHVP